MVRQLQEENSLEARELNSDAYLILSYRATVIAYLKAMVLFVAHGYQWSKLIEDYCRWSLQYDMWCKMCFFGNELQELMNNEKQFKHRGPVDFLAMLPETFNLEEYQLARKRLGREGDGLATLRQWVKRKRVIRIDSDVWQKK